MKSNPFATLAYGAMTLLVAVYIAFVALLMHHDAMPIPVFAGIAFAALAALLLGAKACRTVKLDVAEWADRPNRPRVPPRRRVQRVGLRRLPSRVFSRRLLVGHGLSMAAGFRALCPTRIGTPRCTP